jgi:hypothetical protein
MHTDLMEIKKYLTKTSTWIRAAFMLVLALILYSLVYTPLKYVFIIVVLFQLGSKLLTGELNENLLSFSKSLCLYIYQILSYLTYTTEKKPFPFGKLPSDTDTVPEDRVI